VDIISLDNVQPNCIWRLNIVYMSFFLNNVIKNLLNLCNGHTFCLTAWIFHAQHEDAFISYVVIFIHLPN